MRVLDKIVLIFFFLFPLFLCSQSSKDPKIDSLCQVWKNESKPDTVRLSALQEVVWKEYLFINPDSGIFYSELMYDVANDHDHKSFIAISFNLNGIAYQIKGQNDSAIKYFTMVKNIFEQINNNHGVGISLNNIALALKDKGDFDKCLDFFNQAYELYDEVKDSSNMGSCLHNIGTIYSDMGNNPMALQFFHKALKLGEILNDTSRQAFAFHEIGIIVLDYEKDEEKALDYFLKSLQLREKTNEKIQIPGSLISIAEVYKNQKKYEESISFLNRALEICQEIGEKKRISKTYLEMGSVYYELKDYQQAIEYFKKAKKINEFIDYKMGIALSLNKTALVYEKMNQPSKAIFNANNAYKISDEIGDLKGIELSTKILYRNYKKININSKALKMFELSVKTRDSIVNDDNLKSVINQQYQYEYEKKSLADSIKHQDEIIIHQAEAKAEEEKRKAEEEKRKNQEFILYGVIALLILIVAFSFYLYTRFRLIRRQRNLINEQKKTVDKAYGELGEEKKKVERKNKQIITSINYAKKIQQAILPEDELMQTFFTDHFVLFQPKDIVGGDFYWYRCFGDIAVIACVDCTGHGVPGGFMSMMGSLLLDKIVSNTKLSPSEILGQLSNEIIRVLKQETGGEIQDGMDLSLCIIDKKNKALHFSGARNGIYVIEDKEIKSFKADMLPAGGSFSKKSKEMNRSFTSQTIKLKENSWIMMYSDGFCDQLGGDKMMSMGNVKFEEMLQKSILQKELRQEYLMDEFNKWKGAFPQVDDLLIIGLQV